jgi:hypothetical protein
MNASTRCVQYDAFENPHGAIVPPIYQTANCDQL